jgi:hypothetical protein
MQKPVHNLRHELLRLHKGKALLQAIAARNELQKRNAPPWLIALINSHLNNGLMNIRVAMMDDASRARLLAAHERAELNIRCAKNIGYSFLRRDRPPDGGFLWLDDYERLYADWLAAELHAARAALPG